MKHLGDICKLKGSEVPLVDIITGGSPCQDLSVAGKGAGLAGARSGLFFEQMRLIKEMREYDIQTNGRTTRDARPRFMVRENVPGALSSNKGEDFRAVLQEVVRVAGSDAVIPEPPRKWSGAGAIVGNGWSLAWRIHDAQFWGVPQRRRRISLVADFGGQSAPAVLFERQSLRGDIEESGTEGEGTSAGVEGGSGKAVDLYNLKVTGETAAAVTTMTGGQTEPGRSC